MTKTFVAINDTVHALIRQVTRQTPLGVRCRADGRLITEYQITLDKIPDAYYSLATFHSIGGMCVECFRDNHWRANLAERGAILRGANYFDAVKLDRRCARDLRLKLRKQGPAMLAAELLAFGTGTLRACNDDPSEETQRCHWSRHGRLRPRGEQIYARIRALHLNSLPLLHPPRKESFDSTNVIYGDVLGELEQLWDRRADTAFLEGVCGSLRDMRSAAEIGAFQSPPLNLETVMRLHLRAQSLWRTPPANARGLLRRIDYLLAHAQADNSPCAFFRHYDSELQPDYPTAPTPGWDTDHSGYDGWLSRS
jgi:hypothetical protein